jgi:signal transduction histidine kinase
MAPAAHTDPLLEETLGKLVAECTRAADVVKRLRDFFRSGATHLARTSLGEIVARGVAAVKPQAEANDVAIDVAAPARDAKLFADETQLEIVVRNLLANAIAATACAPAPRRVRVVLGTEATGWAKLSIHDSGPGVREGDVERIFEPFETSSASGMGMGLAISRAIVDAHGGRLWADAAGHGVFHVVLPPAEAADA